MSKISKPIFDRPFFSIIIPCFNSANYIEIGLLPLLTNIKNINNVEVILINDGSTDETEKLLISLSRNNDRVKVITNSTSMGPNYSRNIGIENCTGDFLLFLDSDDNFNLETLNYILNFSEFYNYDIVNFGIQFETEKGVINKEFKFENGFLEKEDAIKFLLKGKIPKVCWNKVYSKEFLIKNKINFISDKIHGRDTIFTLECILNSKRVLFDDRILVKSIIRDNSFSRNYSIRNIESAIIITKDLDFLFAEKIDKKYNSFTFIHKYLRYAIIVSMFRFRRFIEFNEALQKIESNPITKKYLKNFRSIDPFSIFIIIVTIAPRLSFLAVKYLQKLIKNPY